MRMHARAAWLGAVVAAGGFVAAQPTVDVAGATTGVEVMTAFRDGTAHARTVSRDGVRVRVGRRRCAVSPGTALAALVRSRPGPIGLRDFGSCSSHARDAGGLFVRRIRSDRNRGGNGWVYKVGNRLASAGAADPSGPFGRGRLRARQRVTWFFCIYRHGCQRTLALRARVESAGVVSVRVRGYDDDGKGIAVAGARVAAGRSADVTDGAGIARLRLPAGRHLLRATKKGLVRSFGRRVIVR